MKKCLAFFLFLCLAALSTVGLAQSAAPQSAPVHRTTKAVNYRLRGDAVKIDFHGTELMQNASGEAKVTGKKSSVEIDAKFDGLDDPTKFGLEYLSLVLWAISPEGRAVNLGELVIRPQQQPREGHHGHADLRHDRDRGTLFRRQPAGQYGGDGKHRWRGHGGPPGKHRSQVRTAGTRHLFGHQHQDPGRYLRHRPQDAARAL